LGYLSFQTAPYGLEIQHSLLDSCSFFFWKLGHWNLSRVGDGIWQWGPVATNIPIDENKQSYSFSVVVMFA
jgi:hypothetical protein